MPEKEFLNQLANSDYAYGFSSNIAMDVAPAGLSEATIHFIAAKKKEPNWLLEKRLQAYRHWRTLSEPRWANLHHKPIDYQQISYYAAPKTTKPLQSMDEVDPEIKAMFTKLGIPLEEQKRLAGVAVDVVLDSVSVATTFKETLQKHGILFCSFSEAVQQYPDLVKKYMGKVVPMHEQLFCSPQRSGFYGWIFLLYPQRRTLPHGAIHLLSYQCSGYRAV